MPHKHGPLKTFIINSFFKLPLSEKQFVETWFFISHHKLLNLDHPISLNEKMQWLKLYGHPEQYTEFTDKYAVRKYVAKKVGDQYLNELYGVYENENEINFGLLPHKFALKATHGSGWNIFCRDKDNFDTESARKQLGEWLRRSWYRPGGEPNYKNIPHRINCEHLIEDEHRKDVLVDYKIFCFHGQVKLVWVTERSPYKPTVQNFYDPEWVPCPITYIYHNAPFEYEKPENFEKMKEIAEVLAKDFLFVRVDLFDVNSRVIFGELTFYSGGGYSKFIPIEWDYKLGEYLHLPTKDDYSTSVTTKGWEPPEG